MTLKFRQLRADEIEARVGVVTQNGLQLLLYKDARCDMNILDETVGVLNWQRHHSRDNANCTVSIWDNEKKEWIEKEDTGTESQTEAEKGLASDAFKRACFNLGIGRELYTTPFIWFTKDECKLEPKGQKWTSRDKFRVDDISYSGNTISSVTVTNTSAKVTKTFGDASAKKKPAPKKSTPKETATQPQPQSEPKDDRVSPAQSAELSNLILSTDTDMIKFFNYYGVENTAEFTVTQYENAVKLLKKKMAMKQHDERME